MTKSARRHDEAEINMTPMLDIVFIMLIFFVVTATFVNERGLEINQPNANKEPVPKEQESILIRATNSNQVCINRRRVDIRSVRPNIEQLRAQNPDALVVIQPAPDSHAGVLAEIYDQALLAGAGGVSLAEWDAGASC